MFNNYERIVSHVVGISWSIEVLIFEYYLTTYRNDMSDKKNP